MDRNKEYLMGINALEELLKTHREKIIRVFVEKGDFSSRKKELVQKLEDEKVSISFVDKKKLEDLTGSTSHQSFVAEIKRQYYSLKDLLEQEPSTVLILDQIYDPHNFGAILRACECFKIQYVIFSKNKGCPVTPVVTKVSCGGSELVNLVRVSNIHDTVLKLKDEGYTVAAADCSESSESIHSFQKPDKLAFVLGSEEKGIQPIIRKNADHLVYLPMKGQIDSLNVSQAAACFLYHFSKN